MKKNLILTACLLAATSVPASVPPITLVEAGRAQAVIVVPHGSTSAAATELRDYVEKSTGARLEIIDEGKIAAVSPSLARVFVGATEAGKRVVDLPKLQPEGFVIRSRGRDLFVIGRDETEAGAAVDGTYYGMCEFLERFVGMRWLMPGPVGEVVPKQATLRVPDVDLRQEPLLWQRKIRDVRTIGHRTQILEYLRDWQVPVAEWEAKFGKAAVAPWFAHQRLGARVTLQFGHSYGGWWDKYHEQYPGIFALQPNGTRINSSVRERLCVSNPVLWDLVAKDRIAQLRADPMVAGVSIAPNDGGGGNKFCSCERCRALDGPDAQAMYRKDPHLNPGPGGAGPFPSLSERYFTFFNEVAKRVKVELPDRFLGTYAYSLYRSPPASIERLEDNLVVGYVGPNSVFSDQARESGRRDFAAWSKKAKQLMLRPNMLESPIGLPVVYVRKLAEDIRFFVEHGMRLTDFAQCNGDWGTEGLNYYVLAKLLWDPAQPVDPIIDDYCRAAYGAGATAAREYYRRLEALTDRIAATSPPSPADNHVTDFYTDEALENLRAPLRDASAAIGTRDADALERVRMLERGLDFARATRRLLRAAADVRQKKGTREQFAKVQADVLPLYKALAMDFAVASEQDYRRIKMATAFTATKHIAADADDP